MPTPEQTTARDSIERWHRLNVLIGELYEAIPEAARTDAHRAMLAQWNDAHAAAPRMGPGLRASAISDWIDRYNSARAQLVAAGYAAPGRVVDVGVIPSAVRAVSETVNEVRSGFGFGVALLVLVLVWQRDAMPKGART